MTEAISLLICLGLLTVALAATILAGYADK